ncbi:MAG: hypothetical protein ACFFAU_06805 [Candidatus Hodarchaeota archaeon]
MNKSYKKILNFVKNHRYLSIFTISVTLALSLAIIGYISIISPLFEVPDFSLNTFNIKKVSEGSVYVDFTFNFSKPLKYEISIKKISIKLYQENDTEKWILAEGHTLESFIIMKNAIIVENISFIFEVQRIDNLLKVLLKEEKIGIMGLLYFPFGFSTSFSYQPKNIGTSILPSFEILEVHPVPPGSILEILVTTYNPHDITLNLTEGSFDLITAEIGFLGTVSLTEVSLPTKISNLTFLLQTNPQEMTWMFERILNNGTLSVEIQNFEAIFWFGGELINIFLEEGPSFIWGSYDPGLKVLGLDNVSYSDEIISFDVSLGLYGYPLWGYNVSAGCGNPWSVSLDFYHILEEELQIVGNGSTNMTVTINRSEMSSVNVHINIFPFAALEMILIWITEWDINIDIQNGNLCLQFYDVSLQIEFERHIEA